jgi:hypothetical protein
MAVFMTQTLDVTGNEQKRLHALRVFGVWHRWYIPAILATQEAEVGGSQSEAGQTKVQDPI